VQYVRQYSSRTVKETPSPISSPALDDVLGGVLPGRIHLVTGSPGTGKTSAVLRFLQAGIEQRQRCVLLTTDRVRDLLAHADFIGLDIRRFVRSRRLTLLRFREQFATRLASVAAAREVVDELRRETDSPARIVIDSLAPFLTRGDPGSASVSLLAEWLDECDSTSVVTWGGTVSENMDLRAQPLVDRAAVILRMHRPAPGERCLRAEIVRARHAIAAHRWLSFDVAPGAGVVPATPQMLVPPTPSSVMDSMLGGRQQDRPPA